MNITFWGVRGSIPTPGPQTLKYGGNSSCVEVRLSDGKIFILDAGTGIRPLGQKLLREKRELHIHLLLSHGHMDHVHGFPFFAPAYINTNHISVIGCAGPGRGPKDLLRRQMGDIYFPVEYEGLPAKMDYIPHCGNTACSDECLKIGRTRIETRGNNHPGGSIAYKIIEKKHTFVYMTDNELHSDSANAFPFDEFVEFNKGVDILVHDTQYTPSQYKHTRGWGHSTYEDVAELAAEAGVKRLVLFHHDPEHSDKQVDNMVEKTKQCLKKRGVHIPCEGAREHSTMSPD